MLTRFCVLPKFNKIIAGRDLNNVFKEGVIYQATELMGQILLTPVGDSSITNNKKWKGYKFSQIMMDGKYLFTQKELESLGDPKPEIYE